MDSSWGRDSRANVLNKVLKVFPTTRKVFILLPPSHFLRGFESDKDLRKKKWKAVIMQMEKSFIIHLLHSIPHINVSLHGVHMVNSTFNPNSDVYIEVSLKFSPWRQTDKKNCPEVAAIRRPPYAKYFFGSGSEGTPSAITIKVFSSGDTRKRKKRCLRKLSQIVVKSKARRNSRWQHAGW